jgi:hypothetical protein
MCHDEDEGVDAMRVLVRLHDLQAGSKAAA